MGISHPECPKCLETGMSTLSLTLKGTELRVSGMKKTFKANRSDLKKIDTDFLIWTFVRDGYFTKAGYKSHWRPVMNREAYRRACIRFYDRTDDLVDRINQTNPISYWLDIVKSGKFLTILTELYDVLGDITIQKYALTRIKGARGLIPIFDGVHFSGNKGKKDVIEYWESKLEELGLGMDAGELPRDEEESLKLSIHMWRQEKPINTNESIVRACLKLNNTNTRKEINATNALREHLSRLNDENDRVNAGPFNYGQ
jgi:hypothetical protein